MYQRINSGFGRRLGLAAVSVVLFSVSSCGGDDGDSSADFCELATKLEEESPFENLTGDESPDEVKAAMDEMVKDVNALDKSAPDEIAEEAALVKEAFTEFADAMADNDYDLTKAVQSPEFAELSEKFDSDEFTEAGEKLDDYLATDCGITSGS